MQNICRFCSKDEERPKHLFFECRKATILRRAVNNSLIAWIEGQPLITIENTLFPIPKAKLTPRFTLQALMRECLARCINTGKNINIQLSTNTNSIL